MSQNVRLSMAFTAAHHRHTWPRRPGGLRTQMLHRHLGHQESQCGVWPQHGMCQNIHRYRGDDAQEASRIRIWLRIPAARGRTAIARQVPGQSHLKKRLFRPGCARPMLHGPKWPLLLLVFPKRPLQPRGLPQDSSSCQRFRPCGLVPAGLVEASTLTTDNAWHYMINATKLCAALRGASAQLVYTISQIRRHDFGLALAFFPASH